MARAYMFDHPNSPVFDIISKNALDKVFGQGYSNVLGVVKAKQLFAVLSFQAILTNDLDYQYDGNQMVPNYDGVHAERLFQDQR